MPSNTDISFGITFDKLKQQILTTEKLETQTFGIFDVKTYIYKI